MDKKISVSQIKELISFIKSINKNIMEILHMSAKEAYKKINGGNF